MNTTGRNTIAGEMLRGYVERIENIRSQKKQLSDDENVVMAEAKAQGFVPAAIRFVLKKRVMRPSDRSESEAMEDMYLHAMGMAADNPLFRMVGLMSVDITARESVIEAMKQFVPVGGSITIEAGDAPVRLTRDKDGTIAITEVIEKPVQQDLPPGAKKASPPKPAPPDVSADEAERMGCRAYKDDVPIVENPFPYGDTRRKCWDRGWRAESGGDGMGPGEDD